MGPIHAFSTGLRRALACWPAWLMLFLSTLLTAVPLAIFPAASLLETARRTVIENMTSGLKTWQVIDAVRLIMQNMPVADQPGMRSSLVAQNAVYLGLLLVLIPLLGGIVSAFFWGGVLVTYRDTGSGNSTVDQCNSETQAGSPPFRLGRFLWGCWHWFGAFLLLALIQAGIFIAAALLLIAMFAAASALGSVGSIVALVLIALFLGLWLAVFELARVQCLVTDTRNVFSGIGRSIQLIFNHMPQLIGFYALALLALLLVNLLFRGVLMPNIPTSAILVTLVVQQAFILARLFALALRLAGLMALTQAYQAPAVPVAQPAAGADGLQALS